MADQKIIEKIQKLLRLSHSPNEHEAKLAMQRASEMMERHQLSMSEVDIDDVRKSGMVKDVYSVRGQKMKLHWVIDLAYGCAKLFDGTVTYFTQQLHGTTFTFIGTPEDVEAMKAMFEHLYASWFSIAETDLTAAKHEKKLSMFGTVDTIKWAPRDTMKFKIGHGLMFASAIYHRAIAIAEARRQTVSAKSTGMDLMVLKDQMLQEELKDTITHKPRVSQGSDIGQQMGWASGQQVPLGGVIESRN